MENQIFSTLLEQLKQLKLSKDKFYFLKNTTSSYYFFNGEQLCQICLCFPHSTDKKDAVEFLERRIAADISAETAAQIIRSASFSRDRLGILQILVGHVNGLKDQQEQKVVVSAFDFFIDKDQAWDILAKQCEAFGGSMPTLPEPDMEMESNDQTPLPAPVLQQMVHNEAVDRTAGTFQTAKKLSIFDLPIMKEMKFLQNEFPSMEQAVFEEVQKRRQAGHTFVIPSRIMSITANLKPGRRLAIADEPSRPAPASPSIAAAGLPDVVPSTSHVEQDEEDFHLTQTSIKGGVVDETVILDPVLPLNDAGGNSTPPDLVSESGSNSGRADEEEIEEVSISQDLAPKRRGIRIAKLENVSNIKPGKLIIENISPESDILKHRDPTKLYDNSSNNILNSQLNKSVPTITDRPTDFNQSGIMQIHHPNFGELAKVNSELYKKSTVLSDHSQTTQEVELSSQNAETLKKSDSENMKKCDKKLSSPTEKTEHQLVRSNSDKEKSFRQGRRRPYKLSYDIFNLSAADREGKEWNRRHTDLHIDYGSYPASNKKEYVSNEQKLDYELSNAYPTSVQASSFDHENVDTKVADEYKIENKKNKIENKENEAENKENEIKNKTNEEETISKAVVESPMTETWETWEEIISASKPPVAPPSSKRNQEVVKTASEKVPLATTTNCQDDLSKPSFGPVNLSSSFNTNRNKADGDRFGSEPPSYSDQSKPVSESKSKNLELIISDNSEKPTVSQISPPVTRPNSSQLLDYRLEARRSWLEARLEKYRKATALDNERPSSAIDLSTLPSPRTANRPPPPSAFRNSSRRATAEIFDCRPSVVSPTQPESLQKSSYGIGMLVGLNQRELSSSTVNSSSEDLLRLETSTPRRRVTADLFVSSQPQSPSPASQLSKNIDRNMGLNIRPVSASSNLGSNIPSVELPPSQIRDISRSQISVPPSPRPLTERRSENSTLKSPLISDLADTGEGQMPMTGYKVRYRARFSKPTTRPMSLENRYGRNKLNFGNYYRPGLYYYAS